MKRFFLIALTALTCAGLLACADTASPASNPESIASAETAVISPAAATPSPSPSPSPSSRPTPAKKAMPGDPVIAELTGADKRFSIDLDGDGKDDTLTIIEHESGEWENSAMLEFSGSGRYEFAHPLDTSFFWFERLAAADLTGDGVNEIVYMCDLGGNGGNGAHFIGVLQKRGEAYEDMAFPPGLSFMLTYEDGYKIRVVCEETGYNELVGANQCDLTPGSFDEGGARIYDAPGWSDDPYDFSLALNEDGIRYNITIRQYTCISSHADFAGEAVTVFEYENGAWRVVDQWFDAPW